MSREIKFRVWDGYQMSIVGPPEWIDDVHYGIAEYRQGYDSFTWMQYTGLKDELDTGIFEGDVLEWNSSFVLEVPDERGVVRYDAPSFAVHGEGRVWDICTVLEDYGGTIIGNIYEHPDLIAEER